MVQLQTLAGIVDSDGSLDKKVRYSRALAETTSTQKSSHFFAFSPSLPSEDNQRKDHRTVVPPFPTPLHPPSIPLTPSFYSPHPLSPSPSRGRPIMGFEQSVVLATMQGDMTVATLPKTVALRDINGQPIWVTVGPLYIMDDPHALRYHPRAARQGADNFDNMTKIIVDSQHLIYATGTSKVTPLYRPAGSKKKNSSANVQWSTLCQPFAGAVAASDGAHGLVVDQPFLDNIDNRLEASECVCGGARCFNASLPSNAAAEAFHALMTGPPAKPRRPQRDPSRRHSPHLGPKLRCSHARSRRQHGRRQHHDGA